MSTNGSGGEKSNKSDGQSSKLGFAETKTKSLDSIASVHSDDRSLSSSGLSPEYGTINLQYSDSSADCCAFFAHCDHKRIILSKAEKGKLLFLPYVPLRTGETWKTAAKNGVLSILSSGDNSVSSTDLPFKLRVVNILRIQLPETGKFATRIIYDVHVDSKKYKCCVDGKRTCWSKMEDVEKGWPFSTVLYGAEPYLLLPLLKDSRKNPINFIEEFTTDDALVYHPDETVRKGLEEAIAATQTNAKEILLVLNEFLGHCYPSFKMTFPSFVAYLEKNGVAGDYQCLFRTFMLDNKGYLLFNEFLLGLIAIDLNTGSGASAMLRCNYVFNYYDQNHDGLLEYADILRMTTDIMKNSVNQGQPEMTGEQIEAEAKQRWETLHSPELMAAFNLKSANEAIPLSLFSDTVTKLVFRGTSTLVRSNVSLKQILERRTAESAQSAANAHPSGIAKRKYKGVCPGCRVKKYSLATHSLKLNFQGLIVNPILLKDSEGRDLTFPLPYSNPRTEQMDAYSIETIFANTEPNYALYTLRQLDSVIFRRGTGVAQVKPDDPNLKRLQTGEWMDSTMIERVIPELCRKAEELLSREPRVVKVSSPCYVLGDIHGNFSDLMTYERILWRKGPWAMAENFLFLGDYVDRGDWGVECVCYLLACKLLAPDKFFLCRGNHEIREIQQMFTFETECKKKYGDQLGSQIWEMFNRVFDRMPICGVIDDSIYCAHGGIPFSDMRIDSLMKIPTPLARPEQESPSAWQIMWNDPMNKDEFDKLNTFQRNESIRGFVPNDKRGTGFYYTEEAVDNFLQINGLSHIIRGHEVITPGYKFQMNGKVITIFSCSGYCGLSNQSAAVFVDNETMRIVRLDTHTLPEKP
ncbi:Serine/threonine-protein phosphatase PP1 isozyme 3 [Halotydeus destructor]|nr:Serine/threonine-protein phosphatase PP1 isozyme 3 [Halotydeus destructor]